MPRVRFVAAFLFVPALLILYATFQLWPSPRAQVPPAWHDTGMRITNEARVQCFDAVQAHVLLRGEADGTYAYNWETRQRTRVSPHIAVACGPSGLLFEGNTDGSGPAW